MTLGSTASPSVHPGLVASRTHIDRMTGPLGLYQHAHGSVPALEHGYCTDDEARLLMLDLRHARRWPDADIGQAVDRDLRFLELAFSTSTGRFRNLLSADGSWLDDAGTPDSHGRAVQALGATLALTGDGSFATRATRLLRLAFPMATALREPRPLAYVVLGLLMASDRDDDGLMRWAARRTAHRLADLMPTRGADWPWPEDVVTYDNGVIPQALIEAGGRLDSPELSVLGTRCLEWLREAQMADGHLRPIGNKGWWRREGSPARFDQQPIEAASLLEAAAAAYRWSGDGSWADMAHAAFGWFLGDNDGALPLAEPEDGSCRDGLAEDGTNRNRGAESTLAWLMSVETMARLHA